MGMKISQMPTDRRFKDLRGQVFGRLEVISFWGKNKFRNRSTDGKFIKF